MRSVFLFLMLSLGVGTTLGLAGCGQKGKLVLPSQTTAQVQVSDQGAP